MRTNAPERLAAMAAGEPFYETGEPCIHGHVAKRRTVNRCCVVCAAESASRYHAARPGLAAEWTRKLRAKDPQPHRDAAKRWADANPDYVKENNRRRIARTSREEANAAHKRWRMKNLAHVRAYNAERSRIRRGLRGNPNGGSYTAEDIEHLREQQNGCCNACKEPNETLQIDHIVAITKGGTSHPSNIQLLCATCNKSKWNKDFTSWMKERGYIAASVLST